MIYLYFITKKETIKKKFGSLKLISETGQTSIDDKVNNRSYKCRATKSEPLFLPIAAFNFDAIKKGHQNETLVRLLIV